MPNKRRPRPQWRRDLDNPNAKKAPTALQRGPRWSHSEGGPRATAEGPTVIPQRRSPSRPPGGRLMGRAAGSAPWNLPLLAQIFSTTSFAMQNFLPPSNGPPNVLHYDPFASTNRGCSWSHRPYGALGHTKRARSSARTPFLRASGNLLGLLPALEPLLEPPSNEPFRRPKGVATGVPAPEPPLPAHIPTSPNRAPAAKTHYISTHWCSTMLLQFNAVVFSIVHGPCVQCSAASQFA